MVPKFMVALLMIAELWDQPVCPTAEECLKKRGHVYAQKKHSSHKGHKALSSVENGGNQRPPN